MCGLDFKKCVVFDCSLRFLFYIFYFKGGKKMEICFLYQFLIGNVKDEVGSFRGLDSFFFYSLVPIGLALVPAVFHPPRSPGPW